MKVVNKVIALVMSLLVTFSLTACAAQKIAERTGLTVDEIEQIYLEAEEDYANEYYKDALEKYDLISGYKDANKKAEKAWEGYKSSLFNEVDLLLEQADYSVALSLIHQVQDWVGPGERHGDLYHRELSISESYLNFAFGVADSYVELREYETALSYLSDIKEDLPQFSIDILIKENEIELTMEKDDGSFKNLEEAKSNFEKNYSSDQYYNLYILKSDGKVYPTDNVIMSAFYLSSSSNNSAVSFSTANVEEKCSRIDRSKEDKLILLIHHSRDANIVKNVPIFDVSRDGDMYYCPYIWYNGQPRGDLYGDIDIISSTQGKSYELSDISDAEAEEILTQAVENLGFSAKSYYFEGMYNSWIQYQFIGTDKPHQQIILGRYNGTDYQEITLNLDHRLYFFEKYQDAGVEKTQNGYFILDISELPQGYYFFEDRIVYIK